MLGYSNQAHFKTSDQANSVMWARYMVAWWSHEELHLGRAVPRAWLAHGREVALEGVVTYYGRVSARFTSEAGKGRIVLEADLEGRDQPARLRARFRHPDKAPLRAVEVNGRSWSAFDPRREDVDLTGLAGHLEVEARY
ncbi:MAG: hypothetical protein ABIL09_06270 [Gemmatimonadota bacterium]